MSAHNSRHGTTCSISSRNTCRRVFFVYRSKPFIVARLLCCLCVDLIWRNLLYIPVERGDLIQSLPSFLLATLTCGDSGLPPTVSYSCHVERVRFRRNLGPEKGSCRELE